MSARRDGLNIAMVTESYRPDAGGLERSTAQIAAELCQRGHRVTLLAGACPDTDCLPGVTIQALARRKDASAFRLYRFYRWATRSMMEGGFDTSLSVTSAIPAAVIQPRGGTAKETLLRNIAMRSSRLSRMSKQCSVWLSPKQQLLLALEKRAFSHPGLVKVVAVSRYVSRQLQQHYGVSSEKIELVPNAAVMPEVDDRQRAEWRRCIREQFQVPDSTPAFLFAAINPKLKGYSLLLKALAILKDRGVPAVVLLAGDFWHRHAREAEQAGVRERVRFIRHTRRIEALYAAADVTVHPTYYDPASKVVIESLMMGVPAISTSYNGASDWIEPVDGRERGRVIRDMSTARPLADAMQALTDPDTRRACRDACEGIRDSLSMVRHVDHLERILLESARSNP